MYLWKMKKEEALKSLKTIISGLSDEEAKKRLSEYGENKIEGKKKKSIVKRFLAQFKDFSIIALIVSAFLSYGVSFAVGDNDITDPLIILAIVILNAVIGVIQEAKAMNALEALKNMTSHKSTVIRQGREVLEDAEKIVPGDILSLKGGDMIPADCIILKSGMLKVNEASLTGEAESVEKTEDAEYKEDVALTDRKNLLFASTLISEGHALALVYATGMNTKMGSLASMMRVENEEKTPLAKRLNSSSKVMVLAAVICCVLLFLIGIIKKYPPLFMFMTSVSLAVAAIPEGLSAIVTVMLALSVSKMAKRGAIIRNLPAVETLGSANYICTDKTGTLTENKMKVSGVVGDEEKVLTLMALCSEKNGNPTEEAILKAWGGDKDDLDKKYERIKEIPFSSGRKRMLTVNRYNGGYITIVKGAFDIILPFCTKLEDEGKTFSLTNEKREELKRKCDEMAGVGMRVIALAVRETDEADAKEKNMTFLGMVALSDPLRKEAGEAVKKCLKAGIRVIMITGDHKKTALFIAKELSLDKGGVLEGSDIDKLSDEELKKALSKVSVFARVMPEHKVRIVKVLKSVGNVVAMTGDGVNDGPALSNADIGIAMGKSGTDVARCASDMVLTDDNFATIVTAVSEGRVLYSNIKNAIHFLLSSNMGEIILMMAGFLLGNGAVLYPVQLLWVNLITDSLPAISLGMDKGDGRQMEESPRKRGSNFFEGGLLSSILTEGALIGAIAYCAYTYGNTLVGGGEVMGRTFAFCTLSISQLFHAFSVRERGSIFSLKNKNIYLFVSFLVGVFLQYLACMNNFLCKIFKTIPLSFGQWLIVMGFSLIPLIVGEISKVLKVDKK